TLNMDLLTSLEKLKLSTYGWEGNFELIINVFNKFTIPNSIKNLLITDEKIEMSLVQHKTIFSALQIIKFTPKYTYKVDLDVMRNFIKNFPNFKTFVLREEVENIEEL